jgi:hypothetical protein
LETSTRASAVTMGDVAGTMAVTADEVAASLVLSFRIGEVVGKEVAVASGEDTVPGVALAGAAAALVDGGGGAKLCLESAVCVASLTETLLVAANGICDPGRCTPGVLAVEGGRATGPALLEEGLRLVEDVLRFRLLVLLLLGGRAAMLTARRDAADAAVVDAGRAAALGAAELDTAKAAAAAAARWRSAPSRICKGHISVRPLAAVIEIWTASSCDG